MVIRLLVRSGLFVICPVYALIFDVTFLGRHVFGCCFLCAKFTFGAAVLVDLNVWLSLNAPAERLG